MSDRAERDLERQAVDGDEQAAEKLQAIRCRRGEHVWSWRAFLVAEPFACRCGETSRGGWTDSIPVMGEAAVRADTHADTSLVRVDGPCEVVAIEVDTEPVGPAPGSIEVLSVVLRLSPGQTILRDAIHAFFPELRRSVTWLVSGCEFAELVARQACVEQLPVKATLHCRRFVPLRDLTDLPTGTRITIHE